MSHVYEKSVHTPGPWAVENPMEFELSIVQANLPTYEWKFIASVALPNGDPREFGKDVAEANARLIAAAPELLQALKHAVQDCSCSVGERASGHHVDCRAPEWKEVIAKAEGRDNG